jgi:hypothetical protein
MSKENSPVKAFFIRAGFRLDFSVQSNYNKKFIVRISNEQSEG